jgi:hypothetical protein
VQAVAAARAAGVGRAEAKEQQARDEALLLGGSAAAARTRSWSHGFQAPPALAESCPCRVLPRQLGPRGNNDACVRRRDQESTRKDRDRAGPPNRFSAAALGGAQAAADSVRARGRITDLEILDILDTDSLLKVNPLESESMRPARLYHGHLSMSSASSLCTDLHWQISEGGVPPYAWCLPPPRSWVIQ